MIEGKFTVLSEDGVPIPPEPRRRVPRWVVDVVRHPLFWAWCLGLTFIGAVEGLY